MRPWCGCSSTNTVTIRSGREAPGDLVRVPGGRLPGLLAGPPRPRRSRSLATPAAIRRASASSAQHRHLPTHSAPEPYPRDSERKARGYRTHKNFINMAYLILGKLDLRLPT
ncbi:hypothetical protein A5904_15200 (plasmid) [Acidithiobacillus caldus]|nr:hypothetical protein A5904_15200 [Acidithiobacillus caldus]